jgi:cell division protein FtsB
MINYKEKGSVEPPIFQEIKNRLKAYVKYVVVIFSIFLVFSLVRNINNRNESLRTIANKESAVKDLEGENQELRESLDKIRSDAFIEKQIRDQLGLAKSGEIVLVLPEDDVVRNLVPDRPKEEEELPDPVWKKWYKLFVY